MSSPVKEIEKSSERSPLLQSFKTILSDKDRNRSDELVGKNTNEKIGFSSIGIIYGLISTLLYAFESLITKLLLNYSPLNITLWRFSFVTLISLLPLFYYWKWKEIRVFAPIWPLKTSTSILTLCLLIIRGVLGCASTIFATYAFEYISIGDSTVIGACYVVFVTTCACIFLNEDCGVFPIFIGFLSLAGVVIISRPPFITGEPNENSNAIIGVLYSVAGMLSNTFVFVILRYLKNTHFSVVVLFNGLFSSIVCLLLIPFVDTFSFVDGSVRETSLLFLLGGFGFFSQFLFTFALIYEQAGTISFVRSLESVMVYFLQIIFLREIPDWLSIGGATLVIFSVLLASARKILLVSPIENKYGQFLNVLTK